MNKNYTIRNASCDDIEILVDYWRKLQILHQRENPTVWTMRDDAEQTVRKYFDEKLGSADFFTKIAFDSKGESIGFVMGEIQNNIPIVLPKKTGYITDVFVDEHLRGKGIARELLESIYEDFRKCGMTEVRLQVDDFNKGAIASYQKMGYEMIAHKMRKPI